VPVDDTELWQLLRVLDDPGHVRFPADYRQSRVREQFGGLVQRLDADFGCPCDVDHHVEDASLHGRIEIPEEATATRRRLVISVSNFGALAVLAVDNPGVWTDAEAAALLHPDDARRVHGALADLGYTLVPEETLWNRYDGACSPKIFGPNATWWDRYFGYL
jgi:hypothetical protein